MRWDAGGSGSGHFRGVSMCALQTLMGEKADKGKCDGLRWFSVDSQSGSRRETLHPSVS